MKLSKKRIANKSAANSTDLYRHICASKFSQRGLKKHKIRKMGKFGPASEVRTLVKDGVPVEGFDL